MAVYEHTYRPFTGTPTPAWSRFLIIPRSAYRTVFQSKIFIAFFAASFLPPLLMSIMIYLKHNVNALGVLQAQLNDLIPIDASFFYTFLWIQCYFAFFLAVLIGPPLIARDVENNGLPLYLARPLSRVEYVVGKLCVLLILMSAVTWVPLLIAFFFEAYLEGWTWFTENYWMAGAIYFGSFLWIVVVTLLTLAVSAWVKWRIVSSGLLVGLFFIPRVIGAIVNGILETNWANLISLQGVLINIWLGLFGLFERDHDKRQFSFGRRMPELVVHWEPYLWANWLVLVFICAVCLLMLYSRVRAYEVIR